MITAALAYIGIAVVDKVSFSFFPYEKNVIAQSFSRSNNIFNLFSYLENLEVSHNQKTLFDYISEKHVFTRNTNLIIISDFYDKHDSSALKLLKCPSSVVQVVAKEELQPNRQGNMTFSDAENKKTHELYLDEKRFSIYKKNFSNHLLSTKHLCWQHKINYQLIKTSDELSMVLSILQIAGIIK